jgi:hypothetical protein
MKFILAFSLTIGVAFGQSGVAKIIGPRGDSLPGACQAGQLWYRTGATNPGLYVGVGSPCSWVWHSPSSTQAVTLSTGTADPASSCTIGNLYLRTDVTPKTFWFCDTATGTWQKILSTLNSGALVETGVTGADPGDPGSGYASLYFDSGTGTLRVHDHTAGLSSSVLDKTCNAGQHMYSNSGGTITCTNDAAGNINFADPTVAWQREHFVSGDTASGRIGSSGMINSAIGSAATLAYIASIAGHPGILRATTPGTQNQGSTIAFGDVTNPGYAFDNSILAGFDWDFYTSVALGTNSTGLTYNNFSAGIGSATTGTSPGTYEWHVRYYIQDSDTNLMYQVCNATGSHGCESTTLGVDTNSNLADSGVTPVAGTYYLIHIWRRASGVGGNPTVYFTINGASQKTFCSSGCDTTLAHEPSSGGSAAHVQYFTSASSSPARSIDIDYIAYYISGLQLY